MRVCTNIKGSEIGCSQERSKYFLAERCGSIKSSYAN